MALDQQFLDLDELLATIGAAGQRLGGIDASEGAADRIEYAETAAMYEYMNLVNGNRAEGLTRDELREVVAAFDAQTTLV